MSGTLSKIASVNLNANGEVELPALNITYPQLGFLLDISSISGIWLIEVQHELDSGARYTIASAAGVTGTGAFILPMSTALIDNNFPTPIPTHVKFTRTLTGSITADLYQADGG